METETVERVAAKAISFIYKEFEKENPDFSGLIGSSSEKVKVWKAFETQVLKKMNDIR